VILLLELVLLVLLVSGELNVIKYVFLDVLIVIKLLELVTLAHQDSGDQLVLFALLDVLVELYVIMQLELVHHVKQDSGELNVILFV